MKKSEFWKNKGVRRIIIVLSIIYSVIMFLPIDGWPNERIRDQVEIRHCFGAQEYTGRVWDAYERQLVTERRYDSVPIAEKREHMRMVVYMKYSEQLRVLQWIWLILNYIFWPLVIAVFITIFFWIKSGFEDTGVQ
jgi:hypothetical protein